MTWPSGDVPTTDLDAGTDTPPRATFLSFAQKFNELINHVSAFMQGVLSAADAAAARTALNALSKTMNTARILGRSTASAGDVEEISVGANLTLAGGVLSASDGRQVGECVPFARATAPTGWLALPLVPTNISRTTYASLFAAIGTTWGAGDGSTTFGCPYMPTNYAAVQAGGGASGVGTATVGEVISHTHARDTYNSDSGASNEIRAGGGGDAGNWVSNPTGGSANLAAGVRFLWCVKL
jgi:hypothetical protein